MSTADSCTEDGLNKVRIKMIVNVNTFKTNITIAPDTYLYRGGSSSPSKVYIVAVDGDWISYTFEPYRKIYREHRQYFQISVTEGTATQIKNRQSQKDRFLNGDKWAFFYEWMDEELLYLSEMIRGQLPSEKHYYQDAQWVKAFISCQIPNVDSWAELEKHHFDVSSMNMQTGFLCVPMTRKQLRELELPEGFTLEYSEEDMH